MTQQPSCILRSLGKSGAPVGLIQPHIPLFYSVSKEPASWRLGDHQFYGAGMHPESPCWNPFFQDCKSRQGKVPCHYVPTSIRSFFEILTNRPARVCVWLALLILYHSFNAWLTSAIFQVMSLQRRTPFVMFDRNMQDGPRLNVSDHSQDFFDFFVSFSLLFHALIDLVDYRKLTVDYPYRGFSQLPDNFRKSWLNNVSVFYIVSNSCQISVD